MEPVADQLNAEQLQIDTPELVSIEMPLAGIGSRFLALALDYVFWTVLLIVLGIGAAIALAGFNLHDRATAKWALGIFLLIVFLIHWGYFTLFETFWNGATPGKRIAHIHVIHQSGRALSFVEALARNLVRAVDYLPGMYGVGVISIFLSRRKQRLGDMVAGTLVVRDCEIADPYWGELGTRTITAGAFAEDAQQHVLPAPHLRFSLPAPLVAKLSPSDLELLEGFFARRLDLDLATRAALAERISTAVRAKSGLEVPADASTETFLEAVAHQLRELGSLR